MDNYNCLLIESTYILAVDMALLQSGHKSFSSEMNVMNLSYFTCVNSFSIGISERFSSG